MALLSSCGQSDEFTLHRLKASLVALPAGAAPDPGRLEFRVNLTVWSGHVHAPGLTRLPAQVRCCDRWQTSASSQQSQILLRSSVV